MIKKLCIDEINVDNERSTSLEAFVACRKNPGLHQTSVGEVLRRIAGKVVIKVAKVDVTKSVDSLKVFAGKNTDPEASILAMQGIFNNEDTEAVLLIDAENAFNPINRTAMIHNISVLCPIIST